MSDSESDDSVRKRAFGILSLVILSATIIGLVAILLFWPFLFHGTDAGYKVTAIFLILAIGGSILSGTFACISLFRRELPRWPAWVAIAGSAYPVILWINHLVYIHRHF